MKETGVRIVSRDYCPFCGEFVCYRERSRAAYCLEHGTLEDISDEEWYKLAKGRE